MARDPAADVQLTPQRPRFQAIPAEPRVIGLQEYCRLLLARRSIDRMEYGLPDGYQGLRDPGTGQTWLIREDVLQDAG